MIAVATLVGTPIDLVDQPVYKIGDGVSAPTVRKKVAPGYSAEAQSARLEGTVVFALVVDENGSPRDLRVVRSLGMGLDEEAIQALKQWKFRPGMKDGLPVATQCTIEVSFRLGTAPAAGNAPSNSKSGGLVVGDSTGGDLSTAVSEESLLGGGWKDLGSGPGTLSAPGFGKHSYSVTKLDLKQFAYGGTLDIEIVPANQKAEASFDLFPDGTSLEFTGHPPDHGSVAHVWNLSQKSAVHLVHKFDRGGVFVLGAEGGWYARKGKPNDFNYSARVFEDMDALTRRGADLGASAAVELEQRIRITPSDLASRIILVEYYSTHLAADPNPARLARASHVLWMINKHPGARVFDNAGLLLNKVGDSPADAEAYEQGKALWLEQVKQHREDNLILRHAAQYLEIDDPEEAEQLALGLIQKDRSFLSLLGEIYGYSVLGVTARDYATRNATMTTAERAQSDFAKRALATLEASPETDLTQAAARVITEQGGKLRRLGQLSWDYESIPAKLVAKAPKQPTRIRVGGNVQAANLLEKVTPPYPPDAKADRIQGTVRFSAIIGFDGHIQELQVVSGHPALIPAASEAVRQWVYKPTLLNGKPVEVITQIDVNFMLN